MSLSPRKPFSSTVTTTTTGGKATQRVHAFNLMRSSQIPAPSSPPHVNIHLESLSLHSSSHLSSSSTLSSSLSSYPSLRGILLVRNLAYETTVTVHFTLDEWWTTSEVTAHHVASLRNHPRALCLPGSRSNSSPSSSFEDLHRAGSGTGKHGAQEGNEGEGDPKWDRFAFTIQLDEYAASLLSCTLWFIVRFSTASLSFPSAPEDLATVEEMDMSVGGVGGHPRANEWWDNNRGGNYRVRFCLRDVKGGTSDDSSGEEGEERKGVPNSELRLSFLYFLTNHVPSTALPLPPPPPIRILTTPSVASPFTSTSLHFPSTPPASNGAISTHYPSSDPHPISTRLRSFPLKNYAAPSPVVPPSPVSSASFGPSAGSERHHTHKPRLGRRVFHPHTAMPPPLSPSIQFTSLTQKFESSPVIPTPSMTENQIK
ncbi:hypothetical protein H0H87_000938 [Tephrocybe sp. NHM501043]|nr:hypothetical protein H0H87_000938 [Tephrocybe sp. NHM501043]